MADNDYITIPRAQIRFSSPHANIDKEWGPYNSVDSALQAMPNLNVRKAGKKFGVVSTVGGVTTVEEYMFTKDNATDNDIVKLVLSSDDVTGTFDYTIGSTTSEQLSEAIGANKIITIGTYIASVGRVGTSSSGYYVVCYTDEDGVFHKIVHGTSTSSVGTETTKEFAEVSGNLSATSNIANAGFKNYQGDKVFDIGDVDTNGTLYNKIKNAVHVDVDTNNNTFAVKNVKGDTVGSIALSTAASGAAVLTFADNNNGSFVATLPNLRYDSDNQMLKMVDAGENETNLIKLSNLQIKEVIAYQGSVSFTPAVGDLILEANSAGDGYILEVFDGTNWQSLGSINNVSLVADKVPFDNSTNGFNATNVQSAIEEVNTNMIDSFDDITTKSIVEENVTDNGVVTPNHFKNYNGTDSSEFTNWSYITFDVSQGESYRIKSYAGSNARLWIILDSNRNVIDYSTDSSTSLKEETVTISNPSARYMIVNCQTSAYNNPTVIKIGRYVRTIDTTKLKIEGKTLKKYIDDEVSDSASDSASSAVEYYESSYETIADITNEGIIEENHFKNYNGTDSSELTNWRYITFRNVTAGDVLTVSSYAGQNARLWILLDANGNVVDKSSDSSSVGLKTEDVVIPDDSVVSMVVNNNNKPYSVKKVSTAKALDGDKIVIDAKTLRQYIREASAGGDYNILKGKTLVCCGDSITYGADMANTEFDDDGVAAETSITMYQWKGNTIGWELQTSNIRKSYGFQIAERNDMIFYNGGVSGSTMQGISNRNGFSLENGRYTQLPSHIDYLTIFFGWNDAAVSDGVLGTINDNTNESFYGGYNVVLPYLIEKYPYAKIALIVPFGTTENHRNAVRLLANKWGVACFDMYGAGTPLYYGKENSVGVNNSIINANRAKFQGNGAHPNHHGHYQISTMLEHFLRGM